MPMIISTLILISTIYLVPHHMLHKGPWLQKSMLSLIEPNKARNQVHKPNPQVRVLQNLTTCEIMTLCRKPALRNLNHQRNQKVALEINKQTNTKDQKYNINSILRKSRRVQEDANWEIQRAIYLYIATKVRKVVKVLSGAL